MNKSKFFSRLLSAFLRQLIVVLVAFTFFTIFGVFVGVWGVSAPAENSYLGYFVWEVHDAATVIEGLFFAFVALIVFTFSIPISQIVADLAGWSRRAEMIINSVYQGGLLAALLAVLIISPFHAEGLGYMRILALLAGFAFLISLIVGPKRA